MDGAGAEPGRVEVDVEAELVPGAESGRVEADAKPELIPGVEAGRVEVDAEAAPPADAGEAVPASTSAWESKLGTDGCKTGSGEPRLRRKVLEDPPSFVPDAASPPSAISSPWL